MPEERQLLTRCVGQSVKELAHSVVNVYKATPKYPDEWIKAGAFGAIVLVKDNAINTAYLR